MSRILRGPMLLVLGFTALFCGRAIACDCLGVFDYFEMCAGTNCNQFYDYEYCGGGGCIYGESCYISGYGQCCDTNYKTYNIDTDDCDPQHECDLCGDMTHHDSLQSHGKLNRLEAASMVGQLSIRPRFAVDEPIFIPDRCGHSYGLVYPAEARKTGNASSRKAGVPTNGGL